MSHNFIHLDDYRSTIQTMVAEPTLLEAHRQTVPMNLSIPDDLADHRWPPKALSLPFWMSQSRFARHCEWLLDHLPAEYVRRYWRQCQSGHFVFNQIGPKATFTCPRAFALCLQQPLVS